MVLCVLVGLWVTGKGGFTRVRNCPCFVSVQMYCVQITTPGFLRSVFFVIHLLSTGAVWTVYEIGVWPGSLSCGEILAA